MTVNDQGPVPVAAPPSRPASTEAGEVWYVRDQTQEERQHAFRNVAICMGDEGFKAADVRAWDGKGSTSRFWQEIAEAMDAMEAGEYDVDEARALMIAEDLALKAKELGQ
jgi:hypothetical protein